jgi:hypothetical protein
MRWYSDADGKAKSPNSLFKPLPKSTISPALLNTAHLVLLLPLSMHKSMLSPVLTSLRQYATFSTAHKAYNIRANLKPV